MDQADTPGWKWLIEHEGYTLAILTFAAYLFATGSNQAYLSALGVPDAGTISLLNYLVILPAVAFSVIFFGVAFRCAYWLSGIKNWKPFIGGRVAMVLLIVTAALVSQSRLIVQLGLSSAWTVLVLALVSFAVLARSYVVLEQRRFAPVTYVLVVICCWSLGFAWGQSIATTRTDWRVVEIVGHDSPYLVLDQRQDQLVVAPLVDDENGVYENRFLYFSRTTEGLSESIRHVGPVQRQK